MTMEATWKAWRTVLARDTVPADAEEQPAPAAQQVPAPQPLGRTDAIQEIVVTGSYLSLAIGSGSAVRVLSEDKVEPVAITFSGGIPGAPINDPIPSYTTTDLYYTYTVPKPNLTMRLGVQNLFDRLPPFQAGQQFYPLFAGVYDPRRRMFTLDAKMGF
jgi:TonB dependent receptor